MRYTAEEKASQFRLFTAGVPTPRWAGNELAEALYSASELRLWPDAVDSVSEEQALMCWRLIERLRVARLPDELRM
jgi:hypothetical protein